MWEDHISDHLILQLLPSGKIPCLWKASLTLISTWIVNLQSLELEPHIFCIVNLGNKGNTLQGFFYSFKNYSKERLMLISHESIIVYYLSGSFFCRIEISKVCVAMVAWKQFSNFCAEKLCGRTFCIAWHALIQIVKQRSEEGFSICFFAFRKIWENTTNNISSLCFEVSSPGVGGGKWRLPSGKGDGIMHLA